MSTFAARVVVTADPAVVAATVLDWNQDSRWRGAVTGMSTRPAGRAVVGQRIVETLRFAGMTFVTPTTVTAVEPFSAGFEGGSGAVTVQGRREVAADDQGSAVTVTLSIRLRGALAPFTWLLAPGYRRRHRDDMARLVRLLESGASVGSRRSCAGAGS